MGLEYLMKKMWHPRTITNIEKVWKAEEQQKELNRRREELRKKLIEERYHEELKRQQVAMGVLPKSSLQRLDFMYEMGTVSSQRTGEEYLKGQVKAQGQKGKEERQVQKESRTNQKCEDFSLLHEDPLFGIKQQEHKIKSEIRDNPQQMRKIYAEIEKLYQSTETTRDRSRETERAKHSGYSEFLKKRLGRAVREDEDGRVRPDFGRFKREAREKYLQRKEEDWDYDQAQKEGQRLQQERKSFGAELGAREKPRVAPGFLGTQARLAAVTRPQNKRASDYE